jgi:hypothetical protein
LIEAMRRQRELSATDLLTAIIDEATQFSLHEQHNDLT